MIKLRLILRWLLIPLWFAIFIVYLPIWYLQMSWYYFDFSDYWDSYKELQELFSQKIQVPQIEWNINDVINKD